jgi:hypothetical protein
MRRCGALNVTVFTMGVSGLPIVPFCGRRISPTHRRQGAADGSGRSIEARRVIEVRDAQGPRALGIAGATTIPASNPDAAVRFIGQQQWQAIHDRRAAGHGISAIAREFVLDRKTVRSCLLEWNWRPYQRRTPAASLLDPYRAWLVEHAPQVT